MECKRSFQFLKRYQKTVAAKGPKHSTINSKRRSIRAFLGCGVPHCGIECFFSPPRRTPAASRATIFSRRKGRSILEVISCLPRVASYLPLQIVPLGLPSNNHKRFVGEYIFISLARHKLGAFDCGRLGPGASKSPRR